MSIQVPQSVMEVLDRAIIDGSKLTLTGTLDRNLYVSTNKVIEAAGGKWNRAAKAHVFDGEAADAIEPILLTGEYSRTKQDFGQFDTPSPLAREVVILAKIDSGDNVLEPSAGIGNLAVAAEEAGGVVVALEIDERRSAKANERLLNGCRVADFLCEAPHEVPYGRIVMNPPFAKQADIHHVLHALKFLRSDGLLVSIMSASVLFRSNKLTDDFRQLVEHRGGAFSALPNGSFKESGTGVNACVVTVPA